MNFKQLGIEFDKSIIIIGDTHASWREINTIISSKKPEIVLQVGDFGWWPKFHNTTKISSDKYKTDPNFYSPPPDKPWLNGMRRELPWNQYGVKPGNGKIYFCPGNHEDWEDLESKATSDNPIQVEVMPNVFYMPRCSTLKLPDGRTILFMGGAVSVDKEHRTYRYDWFPEETIKQKDIYNLPDVDIDIVVSHTSPQEFKKDLFAGSKDWHQYDPYWLEKFNDPSCHALSHVLRKYTPSLWFFGHYHVVKTSTWLKTRWFALNKANDTGWWTYLPKI
jgi:hypothetical protein